MIQDLNDKHRAVCIEPRTFASVNYTTEIDLISCTIYDFAFQRICQFIQSDSLEILRLDNATSMLHHPTGNQSDVVTSCAPNILEIYLSNIVQCEGFDYGLRYGLRNCTKLQVLDVSNNDIGTVANQTLWKGMFQGLKNLHQLNLAYNSLTYLTGGVFEDLLQLKRLSLRGNPLQAITEASFPFPDYLTRMSKIDISDIRYSCVCADVGWLVNLLPFLEEKLVDTDSITCDLPMELGGEKLLSVASSVCPLPDLPLGLVTLLQISGFILGATLIASVTYRLKWDILFCMFQIKSALIAPPAVDGQETYQYDAFISYNNKNVLWLKDHFLPVVEGQFKFKLCLHDRDWMAGIDIVDNITMSITNSRKVILIISNAYTRSQWCQLELTMAQHHLFEKDKNRLILVMMERIHKYNMTPRLALQMRTRTYIEWTEDETGKELFYQKIKRALSKKSTSIMRQMVDKNTIV